MSQEKYFLVFPTTENSEDLLELLQNLIKIYTPTDYYHDPFHPLVNNLYDFKPKRTCIYSEKLGGICCLKSELQNILEVHFSQKIIDLAFSQDFMYEHSGREGWCNVIFSDKKSRFLIKELEELESNFFKNQGYKEICVNLKCQDLHQMGKYVRGKIPVTEKICSDLDYIDSCLAKKAGAELIQNYFKKLI